jgi:hypothetical protein
MMRKASYYNMIALAAVAATMVAASFTGLAYGHAHMTITPTEENANPISVVIGHTNEPTYGALAGIHDGKHNVEVSLEDAATALPLSGANLTVDKYYFRDTRSFEIADSPENADVVERNVTLSPVFGDAGHYMARQVMQPGIYGYRLYGTIDYFGVAEVPIDTTVFCMAADSEGEGAAGNTSKFNSEGWEEGYGCTERIADIYFPNTRARTTGTAAELDGGEDGYYYYMLQTLAAGIPATGVVAFLGVRKFRRKDGQ